MRTRLLTPFVSAVAGSVLLLTAMFAWNVVHNDGTFFGLSTARAEVSDPAVAEISPDVGGGYVTATLEVEPTEGVLGEWVDITSTVEITNGAGYTTTWYVYNDDGWSATVAGPVEETVGDPPLSAPAPLSATGTISFYALITPWYGLGTILTDTVGSEIYLYTPDVPVEVYGPVVTATLVPEAPAAIGDEFDAAIYIANYSPNSVYTLTWELYNQDTATVVEDVSVNPVDLGYTDATGIGESIVITRSDWFDPLVISQTGTYSVAVSIELYDGLLSDDEDLSYDAAFTVEEPVVTLNANPTNPFAGVTPVSFTVSVENVNPGIIEGYDFGFGNGEGASTTDAGFEYTYDEEGTYTAEVTVTLASGFEAFLLQDEQQINVQPVTPDTLLVSLEPQTAELVANSEDTIVVTATVLAGGTTPQPGETVEISITSSLGNVFLPDEEKSVSGTTDADGVFTTTLRAGFLEGDITLEASGPTIDNTATATYDSVFPAGWYQEDLVISRTDVTSTTLGQPPITIIFPAQPGLPVDAVSVTIVLKPLNPPLPPTVTQGIVVRAFTLLAYYQEQEITPELLASLNISLEGVLVTVSYTDTRVSLEQLNGAIESTLELYDVNDRDNFISLPSTVNEGANTVTGEVESLGDHALIGQDTIQTYIPIIIRNGP